MQPEQNIHPGPGPPPQATRRRRTVPKPCARPPAVHWQPETCAPRSRYREDSDSEPRTQAQAEPSASRAHWQRPTSANQDIIIRHYSFSESIILIILFQFCIIFIIFHYFFAVSTSLVFIVFISKNISLFSLFEALTAIENSGPSPSESGTLHYMISYMIS